MRILSPKQITELKKRFESAKELLENTQEIKEALSWVIAYMQECERVDFVDGMHVYNELERRLSGNEELAINVSGLIALDYSVGLFCASTLLDQMKSMKPERTKHTQQVDQEVHDPDEDTEPDTVEDATEDSEQDPNLEDSENEVKEDPEQSTAE